VIVTDKLKSYAAAKREILPKTEHRQSRYLNNRWRFCTNQHDDENGRCSGTSRRTKHSASYLPVAVFTPTSSFAAISYLPPNTAPFGRLPSAYGAM
jgi:transposase-like protein